MKEERSSEEEPREREEDEARRREAEEEHLAMRERERTGDGQPTNDEGVADRPERASDVLSEG